METQELTFEEKVKIIRESVRQTLAKCEVHQADLMVPVRIVVDAICPCRQEKAREGLSHASFTRCKHCQNVYHVQCFERHKITFSEAVEYPFNNRQRDFIEKYIVRYFRYQQEKAQQATKQAAKQAAGHRDQELQKIFPNVKEHSQPTPTPNELGQSPKQQDDGVERQDAGCQACKQDRCMCIFLLEKSRKRVKQERSKEIQTRRPPDPPENPAKNNEFRDPAQAS